MPVPMTNEYAVANRRLLRDDVYERLLSAIIDGTLEPGERLHDEELAGWLGVSRTPIREAITRLVDLGLIEMEPNRYTKVADLDIKRFLDAERVQACMYGLAVELSFDKLTESDWTRLSTMAEHGKELSQNSSDLFPLLNAWEIFQVFVERADNAILARTLRDIAPEVRRVARIAWQYVDSKLLSEIYSDLLDAVRRRDQAAISQIVRERPYEIALQIAEQAYQLEAEPNTQLQSSLHN